MRSRLAEVPPERLAGWLERFAAGHGAVEASWDAASLHLAASDGTIAELAVPWWPLEPGPALVTGSPALPSGAVAVVAEHAARQRTAAVALVRRGGYAVGLARGGQLLDHATGTRYVQSRTAAGGWSQQRYARRRSGQAAGLVDAATGALEALVARAAQPAEVLVVGGDRALLAEVLSAPRLAAVAALPRGPLLDVGEPRLAVLAEVAHRARAVRVLVRDP